MKCDKMVLSFGRIAQLVRAFASHARGQGFESLCVHQFLILNLIETSLVQPGGRLFFNKFYFEIIFKNKKLPVKTDSLYGGPSRTRT